MHKIPRWMLWVILFGVCMDLAISGVLSYLTVNQHQTTSKLVHIGRAADCWDRILDAAVDGKTSHDVLVSRAQVCVKLVP